MSSPLLRQLLANWIPHTMQHMCGVLITLAVYETIRNKACFTTSYGAIVGLYNSDKFGKLINMLLVGHSNGCQRENYALF